MEELLYNNTYYKLGDTFLLEDEEKTVENSESYSKNTEKLQSLFKEFIDKKKDGNEGESQLSVIVSDMIKKFNIGTKDDAPTETKNNASNFNVDLANSMVNIFTNIMSTIQGIKLV